MRRTALACGVLVAAVATAGLLGLGTGGNPARSALRTGPLRLTDVHAHLTALTLPRDCQPSPAGPPTAPVQLGTVLQIGHPAGTDQTVPDGTVTSGPISVTGIAASACGVVSVVAGPPGCPATGTVTIPADGQYFAPLTAVLGLVPGQPVAVPFKVVPQAITASLGCASTVNGLVLGTAAAIEGSTGLFSVACAVGPSAAHLTGTLNSPDQSFTDFRGTLTGTVALPVATVSPTCPAAVATNLDSLAGLPRTGQVTLPVKAALYLPGQAP